MNVPRRRRLPFRPITPTIYYDDFNRSDGTLGANWVWTGNHEVTVGDYHNLADYGFEIVSNPIRDPESSRCHGERHDDSSDLPGMRETDSVDEDRQDVATHGPAD